MRKQAYIIERIDDAEHQPVYRASHIAAPALDPSAAWMTSQLMEEVLTHGTAASARSLGFKLPAAGKTGPIAWQMHNKGLFDEYKDVRIEENPKEDRLITVEQ